MTHRNPRARFGLRGDARPSSGGKGRRVRPSLEFLEARLVMDGPGGSTLISSITPQTHEGLPHAGVANDGWIQSFNHTLPDASSPTMSQALGKLRFASAEAWVSSNDGKSVVFGATDDDWTAIGLDTPGQPFKPLLVARGVVTVTPDPTEANPFAWTVGLYIVRNDTSSGDNLLGAYQLLSGSGSMSADALAGVPGTTNPPAGASLTSSLPIGMITDGANSGVSAGFTPTSMTLTPEANISRSLLTFQGTQSVAYKGSRFRFGLGGSLGNAAKALTIDETGSIALLDEVSNTDTVTVTVGFGGDQQVGIQSIEVVLFSYVTTTADHGLTEGDAFTFSGLVNPKNVENGVTYYVDTVIDSTTFEFSTKPDFVPVQNATADGGGDVVIAGKVKAGGFALSGDARVTFGFTGNAPGALPDAKNGWDLKISGQLEGEFTASDTFDGTFQVLLGSSDGSVPGIEISKDAAGVITIPDWAFVLNGDFKIGKSNDFGTVDEFLDLSVTNLGVTNVFNTTTHLGTLKINGGLALAVAGWNKKFSATLGDGANHDGLVFVQDATGTYHTQSFYASMTVTKDAPTQPADDATLTGKLALHDFSLTLIGSFNADGSVNTIDVTGDLTLAVGDQTPDGSGNWPSTISLVGVSLTQGGVIVTEDGLSFPDVTTVKLTASGTFKIGPLELVAQNLVLEYSGDGKNNPANFFLIGGTITLPQLKGVSVTLGDGGDGDGLKIFTSTGHWELDGFKLVIPEIVVGPVELDNVTIGFSEMDAQNWSLLVGGTIVLFKEGTFQGTRITVKLELGEQDGNFIVEGFAVDLRGLDPGIPILDTGGFVTDIGLDAENLNKSDFSIDAVIGAAFGESIQVAGNSYSLVQITAQGKFTPGDLDITGQILLAGGLASGTAQFDADYAIGRYLIDIDMQFIYDFLDGHIRILITPGKLDALATLDLNVPDFIPIIGGYNIGEVGAALELTTERPVIASIASGVVTTTDVQYLRVGDPFKFTYLDGANPSSFDLTQVYYVTSVGDGGKEFTFSETASGSPISGLSATGGKINPGPQIIAGWAKFLFWEIGIEYDFLAGKFETLGPDAIQQIKNDTPSGVNAKTYTYNSDFTPPAPASPGATQGLSTASSGLFQFPITGIDSSTNLYATVNGTTSIVWNNTTVANSFVDVGGIRFHFVGDLSMPSNVLIHASAIPGEGGFDPYDPIPLLPITFTLTSDIEQPERQTSPSDSKQGWHGKFTSPPPQVQGISVVTALTDALGNPITSAEPNLVTLSFQYRTTDPKNTLLNFYYDFDALGGDGQRFLTARVSDLQNVSTPDVNGWQSATITWNLAGLADFPVFAYVVATDGIHSPTTPLYASQSVLPQPQLIAQISVQNPDSEEAVSANDLPGWLFTVTPVNQAVVTGIAPTSQSDPTSLVTTSAPHGLAPNQTFVFQQLQGASSGLVNGLTYYVATVPSPTTFTFAVAPSQSPVSGQTAQSATAFSISPGTQSISILSDANGHTNFYLLPQVQWVRVKVWQKQPGYLPLANSGIQEQGADGSITEYILLQTDDKNQLFTYEKTGLVQGQIFRDSDATGTRTLADPGISGITVYLDQNNDGKLTPGEPQVATAADGVYRFLHTFTPQNPTYNATIRYVLPDGLNAQGATSFPIAISQSQPWATAQNFLIVEPITFSGVAFVDLNANGALDPGEPGLAGERVMVGNDSAVTDSQGYWSIQTNTTGPFNVSIAVPSGATLTSPNANPYVVDASQRNGFGGLNFGFTGVATPSGTGVSGVVFSDLNSNGIHDPGEPTLPGYTVELTGIDGRQATTSGTVTNPGEFHFASSSDFTFLRTILPTNAIGTTPPDAFPQLVPAFDLAALGIAVGAKVDVRVGPLQGNPALNDFAILMGDRIILRLANADGSSTISTLMTGLAPATSSGSNNLIVADVNNDKLDDLIASANGGVVIFLSNGFGRFSAPIPVLTSTFAGRDAVVAIDRAKPFPTFYAANTSAAGTAIFSFTWNPADGAPTAPVVVSNPSPISDLAVGDVNGDAITDLILFAQNGKLFTLIGPSFDTVLSSDPLPPPTSKLSVSKLFGDAYDRVTYIGQIDDTHSTLIVGGFLNGGLAVTQTPAFATALGATTFALPVNVRGGGNLLQDVLVGASGDIILFTNPGGPFQATTVFLEGAHFGASASTADLNAPITPVPAPLNAPSVIATGSVPFVVPAGTVGAQTDYSGSLGLEFATVAPIVVTTLGVFDSGSDGINGTLTARLYDRGNPSVALATLVFTSADPGVLVGGSRFKTLAQPIALPSGFQGMIVAEGFGPNDPDGNRNLQANGAWSTQNFGVLTISGTSRFGAAGQFPEAIDGQANAYAAGTFGFTSFAGTSIPFNVAAGTIGAQNNFQGTLGLEFDTKAAITVTSLGVFDSGGDGLSRTLTATLYNRDTQKAVATLTFTPVDPGALVGASRFKTLAQPLSLPAGFHGMIVAEGFGPGDPDGNRNLQANQAWWADDLGVLSISGGSFNGNSGTYPTTPDNPYAYAAGTFAFTVAESSSIPILIPAGTVGNQTDYQGSLGKEFDTNAPILVTTLGVFDSGGDGLALTITAHLYDRDHPGAPLATLVFTPGDPGTLIGGTRFKTLPTPLALPSGFRGMIVAEGYGPGEPDGNRNLGAGSWSTDTVGGVLSFPGKSFFGSAGAFPTTPDGNPDSYAAGSFGFVTSTTVINTADMTVTGDGDNNPHAIFGQPFTARVNNGVVEFIVAGDLAVPTVRITVSGAAPARLVVGGDLTVALGTVFDVSALGQIAGAGGGLGGAGQGGGGGGTGGFNAGGVGGGSGGGGHSGIVAPGTMGNNGFNGRQGSEGNSSAPGNAGLPGGTAFNNNTVGSPGAAGQSVQGGQPGPTGVGGGGGANGNGIVGNYHGHTGGSGTTPDAPPIGTVGMAGGVGGPGANNVPGVGLTGGSGGGGGGGGSGGGGGGAGGGGGSGGGGGGGAGIFGHGGNGGNGGDGGWGGDGGTGATGGTGGVGGAGGGALGLLVYGRFTTQSATFRAGGGNGLSGTSGPNSSPGGAPNPTTVSGDLIGSGGTAHSGGGGDGGSGGNGAIGAVGGAGGYGGGGGAGGGGAGGTIILSASVLDATTLSVDASGGAGGVGLPTDPSNPSGPRNPNGPTGGLGRFFFNSNTTISRAGWTVAAQQANSTSVSSNSPFVSGSPVVPTIPGLVGGAYDYGLVPAGTFTINPAPQTPGAFAAVIRSHLTWNGIEFPGFDQIMLVNLSATETLTGPMLGAGASGFLSPMLLGGIANDPLWGGSGPKAITSLAPGSAFVFMIPSSTPLVNAQVIVGNQVHTGTSARLENGQVMYLTDGSASGLVAADLDQDGQADLLSVASDGTLLTWHNVTGGSILTDHSTSHINGGHDIGVHIAGSESGIVQGTVFQDIAGTGVWNSATDPGLSVGVLVYVDLNNNNALDPGEPSKTPSLEGAYQITGLPMADSKGSPITYHVRLVLGANGVTNTMKQTFRATTADFAFNVLGGTVSGADFGVQVQEGANDFDLDGNADLVLTDRASGGVYIQFRNASGRLRSSKVGNLPGPDWRIGGVGEFTGDATPDILLANDTTGQMILWEMSGTTSPRIARSTSPVAPAPAGSVLATIADYDRNGTPDLFFQDGATGRVTVRLMSRRAIVGSREIPIDYARGALMDVARLDSDEHLDLLWKTTDGTLIASLLDSTRARKAEVIVGRLSAGSELAESLNFGFGASDELLIQDIATNTLDLWTLDAQGRKVGESPIDIGLVASPLSVQRGHAVSVPDVYISRPVMVFGVGLNVTAGTPATAVVATFTDPDPSATADRYAATVDWGDGTGPVAASVRARSEGGFEVVATHSYAAAGQFTIAVRVVDMTRGPQGREGIGLSRAIVIAAPSPPVTGIGPKVIDLNPINPPSPGPSRIVITFDRALKPFRARNPRNYRVTVPLGGRNAKRVRVPIASIVYDPTALTVTLVLRRRINFQIAARLRILTTTRRGLTDADGNRMTNSQGRPADFFGLLDPGGRIGIKQAAKPAAKEASHPTGSRPQVSAFKSVRP